MASVIRSRGRTKIGAARVQGGSISYINQAGASGRAAMQMGQAITKIGARRKVGMMSSQYVPYVQGYTRVTMVSTKGC